MEIIQSLKNLKNDQTNHVVALGTFDGVHRGHQRLLEIMGDEAGCSKGKSIVLTFEPHPLIEIAPHKVPPLLTTTVEKAKLMELFGVDVMVTSYLAQEMADLSPIDFVKEILVKQLYAKVVVVGFNYTFGKEGKGTSKDLEYFGEKYGFRVKVVPPVYVHGYVVSSTKIRELIETGEIQIAREMLGRAPSLYGEVISGARLARKIGFPTANLRLDSRSIWFANGVYVVVAVFKGKSYGGVVNIGYKPTVGNGIRMVEVHLLDFCGNLYSEKLELCFISKLREEEAFPNIQALQKQIEKDVKKAREILGVCHELESIK